MKLNSKNAWRLDGVHPDKVEPFDVYINFYSSEAKAAEAKVEIERQGYEHCHITPPAAVQQLG